MKFIEDGHGGMPTLELTRRNLEILLAKLDDPLSNRTLMKDGVAVRAVAVDDDEHYADRAPGRMYMPSTDEFL